MDGHTSLRPCPAVDRAPSCKADRSMGYAHQGFSFCLAKGCARLLTSASSGISGFSRIRIIKA